MTILLVILILFALIIVHELGHFIAAKLSGVKVTEFGVGYPPTALRIAKIGDTEYTLNWIPFGGFVRLFGDDGEGQRGKGSFIDAPRGKQALILLAGVTMNLIAGFLLFVVAYHEGIPRITDTAGAGVHLYITDVVSGSPADSAGIHGGDEIVQMEDEKGASPKTLTPDDVKAFVVDHGGKRIHMTYLRNEKSAEVSAIPANAVIPGAAGEAGLGISLALVTSTSLPWGESLHTATIASYNAFFSVWQNLGHIAAGALHGTPHLEEIVGPVGLVSVVGQATQSGIAQVIAYAALISINLAVINLVPIPALDGGRLLVVIIESILRKPVRKVMIHFLNVIGVSLIVLLMVVVTYHDIARLLA
jgi:regulator of sigma E protease